MPSGSQAEPGGTQQRRILKQPGDAVLYVYDFGDDWFHDVKLVEIVDDTAKFERRLIGGEQAFLPEDCGGIPGYLECMHVSTTNREAEDAAGTKGNGATVREAELKDWLGSWTPTRFHLRIAMMNFER